MKRHEADPRAETGLILSSEPGPGVREGVRFFPQLLRSLSAGSRTETRAGLWVFFCEWSRCTGGGVGGFHTLMTRECFRGSGFLLNLLFVFLFPADLTIFCLEEGWCFIVDSLTEDHRSRSLIIGFICPLIHRTVEAALMGSFHL